MTEEVDTRREQLEWLEQWQAEIDALFEQLARVNEEAEAEEDATQTP